MSDLVRLVRRDFKHPLQESYRNYFVLVHKGDFSPTKLGTISNRLHGKESKFRFTKLPRSKYFSIPHRYMKAINRKVAELNKSKRIDSLDD